MTHDDRRMRQALLRFASIPVEQLDVLCRGSVVVDAPKGTVLQRQGEAADWLGFLEHGVVRMFRNLDGREVNLGFELDGGFTGAYDAYMQRRPAQYGLQALSNARLWRFDRPLVDGLLGGHPCWRELQGRIAEAELLRKLDHDVSVRTRTAQERYVELLRERSPLVQRVPQYHLASFLGITPETLSRIRARMA